MEVIRNGCCVSTADYRKPTDKGLLLPYGSHIDARYKQSLLNTTLDGAFQLSSAWRYFHGECERLKVREDKPPLVSQQCVVCSFQCGLCDAGYVGFTCRHLHQRVEEHKGSAIGNHLREQHDMEPEDIAQSFRILRKCRNKFEYLIFLRFLIKELKPTLNKQCDSIRTKLFV